MNICLFGGTFNPIHKGHLVVARAAVETQGLERVIFVPTALSPFKLGEATVAYHHRFAMVALATSGDEDFTVSDLEAPLGNSVGPNYSIDTVRRVRKGLRRSDRLLLLLGADSWAGIAKWKEADSLLRECEIVVVSRPGYPLEDIVAALPEGTRRRGQAAQKRRGGQTLIFGDVTIHVLNEVKVPVSSTEIRNAVSAKKPVVKYVHPMVAEYIRKTGIYSGNSQDASGISALSSRKKPKVLQS